MEGRWTFGLGKLSDYGRLGAIEPALYPACCAAATVHPSLPAPRKTCFDIISAPD
jgi:hypothetical protein